MEIKSRIIPAKPRNKELYFLKGTGGSTSGGGGSSGGRSGSSYWTLIDTDENDEPLDNPYISTNYPIVTKVLPSEPIVDPENPEEPVEPVSILNYLQIGDARLVYEDDALKAVKENGDPLSFYATGELSAYVLNGNVNPENPENPDSTLFSIANATDVILTNPSTDDLLKYNGTKWVNVPMSSLVTGGGGGDGSVTSVGLSVPTGLSVTGSPITSSGTLAISFASGYSIPTTAKQANWDSIYDQTQWKLDKSVFDDLFEKVEVSTGVFAIKAKYDFYSIGGVSAYGLGSGGSGGGTEYILPTASATTLGGIKVGNGLTISSGVLSVIGGGGGSTVTWGTESGGYIPLTVEGVSKSVALSAHTHSQYALTTHNHSGVYEPVFTKNNAFNKKFGTASGTVAQGNDSRIINGQTAYGWGNHASAGYALNSSLSNYLPLSGGTLTGKLTSPKILINKVGNTASGISWYNSTYNAWQDYIANSGTTGNGVNANITAPSGTLVTTWAKRSFIEGTSGYGWTFEKGTNSSTTPLVVAEIRASDGAAKFSGAVTAPKINFGNNWTLEPSGTELVFKYNGVTKQRFLSDGTILATAELTAYKTGI